MYILFPTLLTIGADTNTKEKQNSLVYVSHAHSVWDSLDPSRKPSKRYGNLIQSPKRGLSEMLHHHKEDVFRWIEERTEEKESSNEEEERGGEEERVA
ncbi:histone deacetylase [Aspergillus sclerotialis]|uniref:Histone deacetylase n=1 Tax=Aspergillus sclerotialis TaxID=2070753 RepID=A0A3A2ZWE5_9EURO|nr:histone deacetylase [Aspergillus sclerotialis]